MKKSVIRFRTMTSSFICLTVLAAVLNAAFTEAALSYVDHKRNGTAGSGSNYDSPSGGSPGLATTQNRSAAPSRALGHCIANSSNQTVIGGGAAAKHGGTGGEKLVTKCGADLVIVFQ